MVIAKVKIDYDFLHGVICVLSFGKSLSVSPWPSDGRLVTTILFSGPWRQKAEFSSESPVLFLYICSIYVATTRLAIIYHKKMEKMYKAGPVSHY